MPHTSFSASRSPLDHREHVRLAQEQVLLVVDLEFRAGVLGKQDALALVHIQRLQLTRVETPPGAHGLHDALLRPLLGRVGEHDPALGRLFAGEGLDQDPITQWLWFCAHTNLLRTGRATRSHKRAASLLTITYAPSEARGRTVRRALETAQRKRDGYLTRPAFFVPVITTRAATGDVEPSAGAYFFSPSMACGWAPTLIVRTLARSVLGSVKVRI